MRKPKANKTARNDLLHLAVGKQFQTQAKVNTGKSDAVWTELPARLRLSRCPLLLPIVHNLVQAEYFYVVAPEHGLTMELPQDLWVPFPSCHSLTRAVS